MPLTDSECKLRRARLAQIRRFCYIMIVRMLWYNNFYVETIMPRISADLLRASIKKLERQLQAVEKRQNSIRAEAIKFLVDAQDRLGLTLADLPTATGKTRGRKTGRLMRAQKVGGATSPGSRGKKPKKSQARKKRRTVAPKYRSPDGDTWTGRGKTPRWLSALLARGRRKEEFLIS